jgi:hypothetical protein
MQRRFRFSLRTLVLLFTLIVGDMSWIAWRNAEAHRVALRFVELTEAGEFDRAEAMFINRDHVKQVNPLPPSGSVADDANLRWHIIEANECTCTITPQSGGDWLLARSRINGIYSYNGHHNMGSLGQGAFTACPTGMIIDASNFWEPAVPGFGPNNL